MKKIPVFFALLFCAFLVLPFLISAQQNASPDWMRVQSDNGEFSIEVPSKFDFFFDKVGAMAPQQGGGVYLKNTHLLKAYVDKTLVSFEFYEERKNTLDWFYDNDKINRNDSDSNITTSTIKGNDFSIRQIVQKSSDFHLIRQYFHSKKYIYILTVTSRDGETKTMRRFLDSLAFKPNTKESPDANIPTVSTLKVTPLNVVTKNVKPATADELAKLRTKTPGSMFMVVSKPRPSYTDAARENNVQGTIQLRVSFNENGFTPKIEVINSLREGLLRQAIFAALRIKFLPEEINGKPETVEKVIEYSFTIY